MRGAAISSCDNWGGGWGSATKKYSGMQGFVWSKLLLALNQKENQLGLRSIVFDFEGMGLVLFDCVQCYSIRRFLYLHFSLISIIIIIVF